MKKLMATAVVFVSLIAASVQGGGEKKGAKQGRDGTWVVVGMEQDGMKLPADDVEKLNIKLTIKGDSYTVTVAGKESDKGTSKIDVKKKPNTADIKSEDGANKGKTILAIIEIDGDSMKACYDMEGKSRPTAFSTKEGSGHVLIQYKREAKKSTER
jgi:uncharacterized protein (TIGR03067 family)